MIAKMSRKDFLKSVGLAGGAIALGSACQGTGAASENGDVALASSSGSLPLELLPQQSALMRLVWPRSHYWTLAMLAEYQKTPASPEEMDRFYDVLTQLRDVSAFPAKQDDLVFAAYLDPAQTQRNFDSVAEYFIAHGDINSVDYMSRVLGTGVKELTTGELYRKIQEQTLAKIKQNPHISTQKLAQMYCAADVDGYLKLRKLLDVAIDYNKVSSIFSSAQKDKFFEFARSAPSDPLTAYHDVYSKSAVDKKIYMTKYGADWAKKKYARF